MIWFRSSRVWPLVIAQTGEIEWHIIPSKNILTQGHQTWCMLNAGCAVATRLYGATGLSLGALPTCLARCGEQTPGISGEYNPCSTELVRNGVPELWVLCR